MNTSAAPTPRTPLPEIPADADEETMLTAFLDRERAVVRRKAEGLTDAQLGTSLTAHPSPLTIGGIIKHLAWVEIKWAQAVFLGKAYTDIPEPWATQRGTDPHWEWDVRSDTASTLLSWYDEAIGASRSACARARDLTQHSRTAGCADPGEPPANDAEPYQLRWILLHLIEEYARHAGHLDLLREHIDGVTGD